MGGMGRVLLPGKLQKGSGLQGRLPTPTPTKHILWWNHMKALREEASPSFDQVPSLWVIFSLQILPQK